MKTMKIEINNNKNQIWVVPESEEDLWIIMLNLKRGDFIYTKVLRDISLKDSKSKERRPIDIKLRVEKTEFQPLTGKLRIFGIIEEGPEKFGVKGKHQSAYISIGQKIIIERYPKWDDRTINKFKSSGPKGRALIVAIDYDEYTISLITSLGVYQLENQTLNISGKDSPNREEEIEHVLNEVNSRIINYISKEKINILVIAGPGYLKDRLAEKIKINNNKLKVIVDNVSNGGFAGINEILRRQTIINVLREFTTILAQEVLEEFMKNVVNNSDMVAYTLKDVYYAAKIGAIDKVVVIDKLLYNINDDERQMAEEIIENAEKTNAKIFIITEDSLIAPSIEGLGGIIAILRCKIPKDVRNLNNI
ncbi:MAG: pelota family protein [Caldisphaera sp.]